MKIHIAILVVLISTACFAGGTQTYRDSQGRVVVTATTNGNTTTYRDKQGMLIMTKTENQGQYSYRNEKGQLIGTSTVRQDKPATPVATAHGTSGCAAGPNTDYQLLRDVMQQRAVERISAEDIRIEQETPKAGLIQGIISIPVSAVMFVAVIPMAIVDGIMNWKPSAPEPDKTAITKKTEERL